MTWLLHLDSSEVFELCWCQWLSSQQKQYCSAAIPLALHMNQKTTIIIVHILFIQVVSEKLNGRRINVSQITLRTRKETDFCAN